MKRDDALKSDTRFMTEPLRTGGSERLRAYRHAMARFPNYSFGNVMMISSQCPNASHDAGFNT